MWHFIGTITAIAAGGYICFALVLFLMQARFVYVPTREIETNPGDIGLSYENIDFAAADKTPLHGWFIPAENERGVILFCHGNAGNISHRLETIRLFHEIGLSVFIFDYRGYGRSGGKTTENGTYDDARAAWNWLTGTKNYSENKIVVFGRSLGGAVAGWLAREENPRALILESAFTSVGDMGAQLYPYMPVKLLIRFHYRTIDYVGRAECPVMILHSPDDELVSYEQGRRLYEAAPEPKRFFEISGGHNGGFMDDPEKYKEGLDIFLAEYLDK